MYVHYKYNCKLTAAATLWLNYGLQTTRYTVYHEIFQAENFRVCCCKQTFAKKLTRIPKINFL